MKSDGSGLLGTTTGKAFPKILIAVIALCVIGIAVMAYVLVDNAKRDRLYQERLAELRASSLQLTSLAQDATEGNSEAFAALQKVLRSMESTWRGLSFSDKQTRVLLNAQVNAFEKVWSGSNADAKTILESQETVLFLHDVADTLNQEIPRLQSEFALIVEILLQNQAPSNQVSNAQTQIWRAERIGRNVDKMLRGGIDADQAADQFNLDANLFGKILEGMEFGDPALGISQVTDAEAIESLSSVKESFSVVSGQVRQIFESSPALFQSRQSATAIFDQGPQMLQTLASLSEGVDQLPGRRSVNTALLLVVGAIAILAAVLLAIALNRATARRLKIQAETNDRNQNAILRLLDELADLADGDLTTTATVTEDFTGAIADSVNYTVDQLRILVSRINQTSERVLESSGDTQQTALHLAEAAEHQAQEIAGASAAINEMAVTIDQVSANAAESAGVAERSVSIANNGAKVVQNTIHGMDTIREQIQDTSKRIKRLGESSQEIGDIVGLINDIADQTNILALNAAIQASMAGDAGRGFAVVADEVQRLAERSATATKQIESLVKTIQADTNEAVISMEQTTSEVVRGARLAQDAGVALEEIENVSASLAELIQNISNAARQQASSAGHISNTMNVIQEITSQTSAGTNATAESIGNLSDLALELNESVSDFTLPDGGDEEAGDTEALAGTELDQAEGALEGIALNDDALPVDEPELDYAAADDESDSESSETLAEALENELKERGETLDDLGSETLTDVASEYQSEAASELQDEAPEVLSDIVTLDDEVSEMYEPEIDANTDAIALHEDGEYELELADTEFDDLEQDKPPRSSDV